MRNADLAMYQAKAAGGGGFASYDPQMLAGLVERLELEADLRLALERGELRAALPADHRPGAPAGSSASRRSCAGSTRRAA